MFWMNTLKKHMGGGGKALKECNTDKLVLSSILFS